MSFILQPSAGASFKAGRGQRAATSPLIRYSVEQTDEEAAGREQHAAPPASTSAQETRLLRRRRVGELCDFLSTLQWIMSTEGGDVGPDCGEEKGGSAVTHSWDESEPLGYQGCPHPDGLDGAEEEAGGDGSEKFNVEDSGGNTSSEEGAVGGRSCKVMHSNCSSETCIPTPSCRICFQGAEQVGLQLLSTLHICPCYESCCDGGSGGGELN